MQAQAPNGTLITNEAAVSYDDGSGVIQQVTSNMTSNMVVRGSLVVIKETDDREVALWDTMTYEILVHNVDVIPVSGVTVVDTLARMLSFIHSEPDGRINDNVVTWNVPVLNPGETFLVTMTCRVIQYRYHGTFINKVWYAPGGGPIEVSNEVLTEWLPWPEAALEKTVTPESAYAGDTLTYALHVRNTGPMRLTGLEVTDLLPDSTRFITADAPVDTVNHILTWHIPQLEIGEETGMSFQLVVTGDAGEQVIRNSAVLSSVEGAGDTSSVTAAFLGYPAASLEKTASPAQVYTGDTLAYTLTARNTSPRPVSTLSVEDVLPEGIRFLHADGVVDTTGGRLLWRIPGLEPGGTLALTFRTLVTGDFPDGTIRNTARLSGGYGERDSSHTVTGFLGHPAVSIEKTASPAQVYTGDTLAYTLTVRNTSPRPVSTLSVEDILPEGIRFLQADDVVDTTGGRLLWRIPGLEPGGTLALTFRTLVTGDFPDGTIRNTARLSGGYGERDSSSTGTHFLGHLTADLEKTAAPAEVYVGDTLSYTLHVRNTSASALTDLMVEDPLPANIRFTGSVTDVDTSDGILRWRIHHLDAGGRAEMTFRTIVTDIAENGIIANTATLSGARGVRDTSRTESACPGYGTGLRIIKEAMHTEYNAGDTVTYDLILSNSGVRPGHHILVTDTLPASLAFVDASHNGLHDGANIVTWRFDEMVSGFHDTLHVSAAILTPVENSTPVHNEVWARTSEGPQDSSHWDITVFSLFDLDLSISGPSVASPGEIICYTIVCTNTGTATSFNPVLKDTLPELLGFVSASMPYSLSPDSQVIEWQLPPLAPGALDTLRLCVQISEDVSIGDEIINEAWLSDKESISVAIDIASHVTTTRPAGSGYYAYKTVDKPVASPGDTLTYCIHFGRYHEESTDSIFVIDTLPIEVRWVPGSTPVLAKPDNPAVTLDPLTNELRFTGNGRMVSDSDSILFQVVVSGDIGPGVHIIENRATVILGSDTLLTENDRRSRAETRLIEPFISVKKMVNNKITAIGEILTYTVTITNRSTDDPVSPLQIDDILPEGFRYLSGTAILDSARIPDPVGYNAGSRMHMRWTLADTLPAGGMLTLRYRVTVGLSAKMGECKNLASVSGDIGNGVWIQSDIASAAVIVRAGILDDRGFIFGKVYADQNQNGLHDNGEAGLKGIELILEDGTHVVTDAFGKYSIPNVTHGQHVLRLNENTLPEGVHILDQSAYHMGDAKSILIRLMPGGMAKANFAVTGSQTD